MHNKIWQKKIAVFLVIAMVLSFMPLAWANTGDTMTGGGSTTASSPSALQWSDDTVAVMDSTTYSSLQLAIDAIPANGSGTITIVKDIDIMRDSVVIAGGKTLTLLSDGAHSLNFDKVSGQACIQVYNGGKLVLGTEDDNDNVLTITSKVSDTSIISISSGSTSNSSFVLNNSILKVAENTSVRSGIVTLWNANFEMNGGTIEGNGDRTLFTRGICASGSSAVVMKDGMIKDCVGQYGGGLITNDTATFTMNGGTITNCIGEYGGGLHAASTSAIKMNGGTITQCKAKNGSAVYLNPNCSFQMLDGAITENEATDQGGISVYARTGATFNRTGGMITEIDSVAVLRDVDGMATGYSSLQLAINAIPVNGSGTITIVKDIDIMRDSVVIAGGKTLTLLSDGAHSLNFDKVSGQACIQVYNGGKLVLGTEDDNDNVLTITSKVSDTSIISISSGSTSNSSFVLNNSILKVAENTSVRSGIVTLWNANFEMNGGTIQGNGDRMLFTRGICASGLSAVVMKDGMIKDCVGEYGGGVTANDTATFTMAGGTITNCYATKSGGGIHGASSATINITNGTITGNESVGGGGGISISVGNTFNMVNGEISNNKAHGDGAGIYVAGNCTATISGGKITGNIASGNVSYGGGIYVHKGSTLQLYNTVITENTAFALGGGLWTCSTGDIKVYVTNGGAVYDNNAIAINGDKNSSQAGDDISNYGGSGHLTLYNHMLGGGLNQYYKDGGVTYHIQNVTSPEGDCADCKSKGPGSGAPLASAKRYSKDYKELYIDTVDKCENVALKNVVSEEAKKTAYDVAEKEGIIISGNSASRGGGIGTNGNLIIGTPENQLYTVSIQKEWSDTTPADKKTEVTVWLLVDGQEIGSAKLNASNGWKADFTGLTDDPNDVTYSVKEDDMNGFTAEVGEPKREGNKISFAITNTWATGNLTVSKTVSGSGADKSKAFTFTVTLSDKAINGTYGDMTFKNGVANFTLKHGERKNATGLPAGVEYTVTESNNSGYSVTMKVDDEVKEEATGTVPANDTSEVLFNNDKGSSGGGGGGSNDTSLTVRKVWVTDDGGTAADSVKVHLLQNGSLYDTVTLHKGNNWSYTWYNLGDSDTWTVEEAAVPAGFISTVSGSGTVWTITNDDVPTDTPDEPTTPEEPDTPDEPTTPSGPSMPGEPENPDDPEYGLDDSDVPKGGADAPEDGTMSDEAPKTGDTAPIAVFAVLLLAAAGGFAITRRKRNP